MQTLDDLLAAGVAGRTVLVRSDLNVPLDGTTHHRRRPDPGLAADAAGAHLGRREGRRHRAPRPSEGRAGGPKYSLAPVAARLAELLGAPVAFATDMVGRVRARPRSPAWPTAGRAAGERAVRRAGDQQGRRRARRIGRRRSSHLVGGDAAFVSDGFGVVHRKQASVYDVAADAAALRRLPGRPQRPPCCSKLTVDPERPYVVSSAARRSRTSSASSPRCSPQVDTLLIGGGMAFTFLAAQGHEVGQVAAAGRPDRHVCKGLLPSSTATRSCCRPTSSSPTTFAAGRQRPRSSAPTRSRPAWQGLDIGPATRQAFADGHRRPRPRCSGTARWACSRCAAFADGTQAVAEAIAAGSVVHRRRRRRLRRGRAHAGRRRGRIHPHLHRRRCVPGVPRGQRCPASPSWRPEHVSTQYATKPAAASR